MVIHAESASRTLGKRLRTRKLLFSEDTACQNAYLKPVAYVVFDPWEGCCIFCKKVRTCDHQGVIDRLFCVHN